MHNRGADDLTSRPAGIQDNEDNLYSGPIRLVSGTYTSKPLEETSRPSRSMNYGGDSHTQTSQPKNYWHPSEVSSRSIVDIFGRPIFHPGEESGGGDDVGEPTNTESTVTSLDPQEGTFTTSPTPDPVPFIQAPFDQSLFPQNQFDPFLDQNMAYSMTNPVTPSFEEHYFDQESSLQTPRSAEEIIRVKKTILAFGVGGMSLFAMLFITAIVIKKRRRAQEKARQAIMVETGFFPSSMEMGYIDDKKIPAADDMEKGASKISDSYFGTPVSAEKVVKS